MQTREGRIIIFSMLLGAVVGGVAIMVLRMRAVRQTQAEPEPLSATLGKVSWADVFGIAVAGVALARRIGGLVEPPKSAEAR